MFEVGLSNVCDEINKAFSEGNLQRVDQLLWPALDQFSDMPQLWFYAGNLAFKAGKAALSVMCFERCIELDENPLVLANLGAAYRRLNRHEDGLATLKAALERDPDYEPALVNYGAMWVNEGNPNEGIPYLERAVALGKAKGKCETGAEWTLALRYLESANFGAGFDLYRGGYGAERLVRTYGYEGFLEPKRLEPGDHIDALMRTKRPTLIAWTEQGLGDEIMFCTMLNEAIEHYEIILECHPRLESLHRNSTWARKLKEQGRPVRIYPTRKDTHIAWPLADKIQADYKCAIADLGAFYRRDTQSFFDSWDRTGHTYTFNQQEAQEYRAHLEQLAEGRPIIGLATRGGVMTTARGYRTLRLPEIERLITETNAMFVSFDYDDMSDTAMYLHGKYGRRFIWQPSIVQHWFYDHTAALLAATDMNVLVCQSAAHLSAGIGAVTRVLVPQRCAWRYAPTNGDSWYWYGSPDTVLYRQQEDSWDVPLKRVIEEINLRNSLGNAA
jgi:tetratricopeptide (TPR) repeat protein